VALHLRAMNMLYEGLKHNSTIVVVPSTAVETMELGNIAGITALAKELKREREESSKQSIGVTVESPSPIRGPIGPEGLH